MSNYYTLNTDTGFEVYVFETVKDVEMFKKKLDEYKCDMYDHCQWEGGPYLPDTLHNVIQSWGWPEGEKSLVQITFYDKEQSLEWLNYGEILTEIEDSWISAIRVSQRLRLRLCVHSRAVHGIYRCICTRHGNKQSWSYQAICRTWSPEVEPRACLLRMLP